jgi:hypothetical protein
MTRRHALPYITMLGAAHMPDAQRKAAVLAGDAHTLALFGPLTALPDEVLAEVMGLLARGELVLMACEERGTRDRIKATLIAMAAQPTGRAS